MVVYIASMIHLPTNNYGASQVPDRVIVHSIGEFIDTEKDDYYSPYYLEKIGLSAHYFVTPSGVVIQTLDVFKMAFHAKGHNYNTVGIEVMVPGAYTYEKFVEAIKSNWVSEAQYGVLVELINGLTHLNTKSINRHSDVDPSRKVDPGEGFPWERLTGDICL